MQRALGYAPKVVQPDIFFDFYNKLCEFCNTAEFIAETKNGLLTLIDEIHSELLLHRRRIFRGPRKACFVGKRSIHEMMSLSAFMTKVINGV